MVKISIIWIIGFAIALTSGLTAMGAIAKRKAPELAITIMPANGFALGEMASNLIKTSVTENLGQFPDRVNPETIDFARMAFIAEPVAPEAIAILALGATDHPKEKLMSEAFLLSRRQSLVTAWMIADSGAREDMPALLNYYDTMLRTNASVAPAIISMMAETLANDSFVSPFASLLEKQPPWAYQFWGAVTGKPGSIGNAARLREILYKPNESDGIYRDQNLIRALVNNKQFETAEALYHLLVGQKEAGALLKNGFFEAERPYPPIDWQLFSTGEYGALVTDGKLKLSAIRNSGGRFARRLINLPSRILTMEISSSTSMVDSAQIFITLSCAEKTNDAPRTIKFLLKGKIETLKLDNSQSGCRYYWLDVNGRTLENSDGFDVSLDSIKIISS